MISFIIPAHNEERLIGRTLLAIRSGADEVGEPYEVLVVNDASTDATGTLAIEHGAREIPVSHRQIAATRNSGGRAAAGEVLFFVDADTVPNAQAIRECLAAIRAGAVGGGCLFDFDCPLALWAKILHPIVIKAARALKLVGGCFLFCTRSAFETVGGFDEQYFAGEEVDFIRRLKRQGPIVIPRATVVTSGRKLALLGPWQTVALLTKFALYGLKPFRQREGLEIWYGERQP